MGTFTAVKTWMCGLKEIVVVLVGNVGKRRVRVAGTSHARLYPLLCVPFPVEPPPESQAEGVSGYAAEEPGCPVHQEG